MARTQKRLNTKLLIILSLVGVALVALGIIIAEKYIFKDPWPHIEQAHVYREEAKSREGSVSSSPPQEGDPEQVYERMRQEMKEDWETNWQRVIDEYNRAVSNSGRDAEARIQALLEMGEICKQKKRYIAAYKVWEWILKIDTDHYEATRNIAEFYYERVKYVFSQYSSQGWSLVRDYGEDLIHLRPDDSYGYAIKSHALISLANLGALSDTEEACSEAEELIQKLLSLHEESPEKTVPSVHVLSYWLQAELALFRAKASDSEDAVEQAESQAESYLREAIERNPEEPEAYLNLYEKFISRRISEQRQTIRTLESVTEREAAQNRLQEKVNKAIQELDSCIALFPQDGRFYAIKAQTLNYAIRDMSELEPVLHAFEKALSCPNSEPSWYYYLADRYRIRWEDTFVEGELNDLEESYKYLRLGMYHPVYIVPEGEKLGPKGELHEYFLTLLRRQLVDVGTTLSQRSSDPAEKERYLSAARDAYQYLRDERGEEAVESKIAAGEIAYAEGRLYEAVKQLYQADEILMLEERPSARLKRKLFHMLKDMGHQMISVRYAIQMWSLDQSPGRNFVEYVESAATIPDTWLLEQLLLVIDQYDEQFGAAYRYRDRIQTAKAQVLIQLNRRDEASEVLKVLPESSDVWLSYLRAESLAEVTDRIVALSKLVESHPEHEDAVRSLMGYCLNLGREDAHYYQVARTCIEKVLEVQPDQSLFLTRIRMILSEEDPSEVSAERHDEIAVQAIQEAMAGFEKDIALGQFYQRKMEQAIARDQSEQVDQYQRKAEEHYATAAQQQPENMECIQGRFDIALQLKNWSQAQQIIDQLREKESPHSMLFEGLLRLHNKQWEEAATQLEKFLLERPISRVGHTFLAQAYQELGEWDDAMKEAQLALAYDMNNVNTLQLMMRLLHKQNERTAGKVGWEKLDIQSISEMIKIINRIVQVNPSNPSVMPFQVSYYPLWIRYQLIQLEAARQITPENKKRSLEFILKQQEGVENICRALVENNPQDVEHWLRWAQADYQFCQALWDSEEKQRALEQTEQVFRQALMTNPGSIGIASYYALFLRENDRLEDAEKVLLEMIEQVSGTDRYKVRMQLGKMYALYPFLESKAQEQYELILQEEEYHLEATLLLADLFVRQRKAEQARELYQKFRMHKSDPAVLNREIVLLLNMGRLEEAESLVVQMEKEFPERSREYLIRGTLEVYKANYASAVKYADQVLEEISSKRVQINALLLKSKALYFNRQFTESEDTLIQLRTLVPESSMIGRLLLANVYWAKNERYRSVQELEAAWNISPDSRDIQTALLSRLKILNDWVRLEQIYLELMDRYPQSAKIYYDVAMDMKHHAGNQVLARENMNAQSSYKKAIQWMQTALDLSTRYGSEVRPVSLAMMDIYVEAGGFYREINNATESRTLYQSALNLANSLVAQYPDDPGILLIQAESHYGLGRRQEALQYFEKSLQQVEGDPSLSAFVLERATRVGTHGDILAWAKRKVAERPDWIGLRLLMASMYLEKGQLADQIQELEAARKQTKNQEELVLINKTLAESYIMGNRYGEAVQAYRRLLELNPDHVGALNNLAYLLMNQSSGQAEAVTLAKRAYELSPTDADIMDTYAETLILQQTPEAYETAKTLLNQAIQQKQRESVAISPVLYIHLAQSFLGLDRYDEAEVQLEAAEERLAKGGVLEDVEEIKKKIHEARERINQAR